MRAQQESSEKLSRGEFWIAICGLAACGAALTDLALHGDDAERACSAKRAEFAAVSQNYGDMPLTTVLSARESGYMMPFLQMTCDLNP
jgi:hypothetical protein